MSNASDQSYLKARQGYDNPADLIEALTPQSVDDLIRINRHKFKAYLTTKEELESLKAPIPSQTVKANVSGWTFLTFYNIDKAEAAVFLVGTYPKTTRQVFTSPVLGTYGDLVVTRTPSIYRLEGEPTNTPDLRMIAAHLWDIGMGPVFGLPHVVY